MLELQNILFTSAVKFDSDGQEMREKEVEFNDAPCAP
jgi:hypothetical protein